MVGGLKGAEMPYRLDLVFVEVWHAIDDDPG